jgi:hypothetical protein
MGFSVELAQADRSCSHHTAEAADVAAATPQAEPTVPPTAAPPSPNVT